MKISNGHFGQMKKNAMFTRLLTRYYIFYILTMIGYVVEKVKKWRASIEKKFKLKIELPTINFYLRYLTWTHPRYKSRYKRQRGNFLILNFYILVVVGLRGGDSKLYSHLLRKHLNHKSNDEIIRFESYRHFYWDNKFWYSLFLKRLNSAN